MDGHDLWAHFYRVSQSGDLGAIGFKPGCVHPLGNHPHVDVQRAEIVTKEVGSVTQGFFEYVEVPVYVCPCRVFNTLLAVGISRVAFCAFVASNAQNRPECRMLGEEQTSLVRSRKDRS